MNLLLDTQVALWAITDSVELDDKGRGLIENPSNVIWISVVSLWEISFKHLMAREIMPVNANQAIGYFQDSGYHVLALDSVHVTYAEELPRHHSDPYDRLLIAQALCTPLRLLTSNTLVAEYSDTFMKV